MNRLGWVVLAATGLASCGGGEAGNGQAGDGSKSGTASLVKVQGAGASFPAPLYAKWFKTYSSAHDGVQIDYQSVGSGSGVKAVIDKTVDFGASDAAMSAEEIAQVPGGVQLLPMTAGSIVLTYNLEGVTDLKLSRKAYAGIFLGTVKKWNDPAIAADNKSAKLPDLPINVIVRADSSGTTFVFTKHLSTISPDLPRAPAPTRCRTGRWARSPRATKA
jgi:phosphate transport system substrate-binding protein